MNTVRYSIKNNKLCVYFMTFQEFDLFKAKLEYNRYYSINDHYSIILSKHIRIDYFVELKKVSIYCKKKNDQLNIINDLRINSRKIIELDYDTETLLEYNTFIGSESDSDVEIYGLTWCCPIFNKLFCYSSLK